MKNKIILLAVIFICTTASKVVASDEKRDVGSFSKIGLHISADLYITQGNKTEVILKGDPRDLEKIVTVVENGALKIKAKPGNWRMGDITILVTSPNINMISVSGSGDVVAKETIKTDEMELKVSGSGDMSLSNLQAGKVNISVSGSGDIDVSGKCQGVLSIGVSGSGDVDAKELEAKVVKAKISGSGEAKVFATEKLETSISGSGAVYYKGSPRIDARSSGSGRTVSL